MSKKAAAKDINLTDKAGDVDMAYGWLVSARTVKLLMKLLTSMAK